MSKRTALELCEDLRLLTTRPLNLRAPVVAMAAQMELRLLANDTEKGAQGWRKDTCTEVLLDQLQQEVDELRKAVADEGPAAIVYEAADVCNFAMMIADHPSLGIK